MLPEIFLIFSLLFTAAGSYLVFGEGVTLLVVGGYLGAVAFAMAYSRKG